MSNHKIKTILVDDEPFALKNLALLLAQYAPNIEIVATASDIDQATENICLHQPSLVFLDIELGERSGFDLLEQFTTPSFEVIFVTAHKDFGINAVKQGALDYILKPIDKVELCNAVQKSQAKIQGRNASQTTPNATTVFKNSKVALPCNNGLIFVEITDIIYCESDGRYTRFYLNTDKKQKSILVSKNLGQYESILPSEVFIRIHHHYLVNTNYIHRYIKGSGGILVMNNGVELPVSKRKKEDFLGRLEEH